MERIAIVVVQYAAGSALVACAVCTTGSIVANLVNAARGFRQGMVEAETAHRAAHGRCLGCGYRLVGNASGVCPECGAASATAMVSSGGRT